LRAANRLCDPAEGNKIPEKVIATLRTGPVHEIVRLGRTLKQWRQAFLAYSTTGPVHGVGTEAVNGLIELHRRVARGFRNREDYRLRMFLNGGALTSPNRSRRSHFRREPAGCRGAKRLYTPRIPRTIDRC